MMRAPICQIPFATPTDVNNLRMFDPEVETKFLPEAIRRIAKIAGPDVPVLGFAAAPWTLACYMVEGKTKEGFETVKSFLYHEPSTFRQLLAKIAQATFPYLNAQIAAGAAAVQLFDTWCGELSLADYENFALPAVQQVIDGIAGKVPVIYYTKASNHLMPAVARAGANVLSVDWRADLAVLRKTLGPKVALQGNVDPAILLGPPEKIREATQAAIAALGGSGSCPESRPRHHETDTRRKCPPVYRDRPATRRRFSRSRRQIAPMLHSRAQE